jgi:hypothetical protein
MDKVCDCVISIACRLSFSDGAAESRKCVSFNSTESHHTFSTPLEMTYTQCLQT